MMTLKLKTFVLAAALVGSAGAMAASTSVKKRQSRRHSAAAHKGDFRALNATVGKAW
jgi:HAMP domain-containing protein